MCPPPLHLFYSEPVPVIVGLNGASFVVGDVIRLMKDRLLAGSAPSSLLKLIRPARTMEI